MKKNTTFEFIETEISGLFLIKPHVYTDERGAYVKFYEKEIFEKNNIKDKFSECSDLYSAKGALRGLHYQLGESQSKLLRVIRGAVYDVAIDLRKESTTFGKTFEILLSDQELLEIYIPKGFAHGFISLTDDTVCSYQCGGEYHPELCGGINWRDSQLQIKWPLEEYGIDKVIVTDKDQNWPTFNEIRDTF